MEERSNTWTITVEMTVFAGDMDKKGVIEIAQAALPDILDDSDYMSINVVSAKRDKLS